MKRILILAAVLAWPAAAHAQSPELQQLCADLDATQPGITIRMNGIDTVAAMKLLCHEVLQLKQQPFSTCFSYNLTINEALPPETIAAMVRELQDAVPKIVEGCQNIRGK